MMIIQLDPDATADVEDILPTFGTASMDLIATLSGIAPANLVLPTRTLFDSRLNEENSRERAATSSEDAPETSTQPEKVRIEDSYPGCDR